MLNFLLSWFNIHRQKLISSKHVKTVALWYLWNPGHKFGAGLSDQSKAEMLMFNDADGANADSI